MESCDRSIKFDMHHLASNVYNSLISQNEVLYIEYLPDKLLINDTLFLQQFMVTLDINRADDNKTLWYRRSKRTDWFCYSIS